MGRTFRTMPDLRFHLLLAALCYAASANALAQASSTAGKSADIAVFGGFQGAHPDYGPYNSYGGVFGADFTRYLRFPVVPSLEFRANLHSNSAVSEHSYVVGLRAAVPFRFAQPYADFLVGPGSIHFPANVGYQSDSSTVYSYGGGLDVPIYRNFALRLDVQAQHWNTGEDTYSPTLATVAVRYTIPFRAHNFQRDHRR